MDAEKKSTRDAYGKALVELGESNKDVVVLDADVSKATRTNIFAARFPNRFFNCGCAEQNMMGVAAGLSLTGKIPFVSTFAVFAACRVLDQVRNTVAYPKLNVKIVATHSGITVGEDGASHQSIEDIAVMRAIPNMTVIVPADAVETKKAIKAVAKYQGPAYIRLGRAEIPVVTDKTSCFEIGRSNTIRDGDDVSIIACGIMVSAALETARDLEKEGIKVRVINMHTIKPIDEEAVIKSARETGGVVAVEEHSIIGGLGSAISEVLGHSAPVPLEQVGIKDTFTESGKPEELLRKYGLTVSTIVNAAKMVIERKTLHTGCN